MTYLIKTFNLHVFITAFVTFIGSFRVESNVKYILILETCMFNCKLFLFKI